MLAAAAEEEESQGDESVGSMDRLPLVQFILVPYRSQFLPL